MKDCYIRQGCKVGPEKCLVFVGEAKKCLVFVGEMSGFCRRGPEKCLVFVGEMSGFCRRKLL